MKFRQGLITWDEVKELTGQKKEEQDKIEEEVSQGESSGEQEVSKSQFRKDFPKSE